MLSQKIISHLEILIGNINNILIEYAVVIDVALKIENVIYKIYRQWTKIQKVESQIIKTYRFSIKTKFRVDLKN